ncbi:MAG TPA: sigma-54-dependent Fis family transcriptional regulator [Zoogloea sp.]|uniref:sigma-54-dependent Fis family transcriptional regulator n=1 Tax=Zoogloea sp. TaxID=49181 RepID=UPI002BD7F627|nr:sigma-54-dependent Fis family transcriptional regulator [Zoogloea sp.]HMV62173.1 sigma-54-dependent Fis family transcriptional regulator [Rhodocyclaceae bacterium]HMY49641.1 sigma-54-dependent Fis family transcriptional regulator [Rhodocyclaceae bacterium]HMZ75106.1 sigma-54-dependent Fis family transcriptional regulator [Rhodocyclaceae bacterium]HNA66583.1 sigma-54-dependent Fis family transcriptional regulator [Rhodocyclaceae bacterium]HNB64629.1 sigma-54-dependent Fis family transcriptio
MSPIDQHLINLPVDTIRRSWERCATRGLRADERLPDDPNARVRLSDRLEANARLVAYAQPIMEHLHQQIARSSSTILLADDSGVILRSVGDSDFLERAARVALKPGHCWSEHVMGTNAIGTALTEQRPVAVIGEEHFLDRNKFLTCIAAPIHAPTGGVLGILDISCSARLTQVHALALLQTTTEIIENRLIETLDDASVVLRFHHQPEALASPLEGLAVFNESGGMLACNRRAERLLGLPDTRHSQSAFNDIFETRWNVLLDHALRSSFRPTKLRCNRGREFAATVLVSNLRRVRPAGAVRDPRVLPRPRPRLTLEDMDLGDKAVGTAIRRARRILGLDIPLLIQGETGTGKEVFAQAFHNSGPRRDGPFVAINCAAIPGNLIEAELFGYTAGAYTGARGEGARGKLREAHGGTLFLDEIGDMPLKLQAVLLRVLETRRVTPLGGGPEEEIDLSLVCASHRSLKALCEVGEFRSDLYFRLSAMSLALPPLRERSDLEGMARRILQEESPDRPIRLATSTLDLIRRHPWPGNIRQLKNALRLGVAMLGDDEETLGPDHLPQDLLDGDDTVHPVPAAKSLRAAEVRLVEDTVQRHNGNISAAARELGITRTTLYRKLRQTSDD